MRTVGKGMRSTILVIDSSPSNQQKIFNWLRPTGNQLSFAKDLHSAMRILNQNQPQLIIFSVAQPGVSPKRLIRRLNASAPMAKLIGILPAAGHPVKSTPEFAQLIDAFLIAPLCQEEVLINVSQLLRFQRLSMENSYLREELAFSSLAAHWHS
jgi:PleD family two-component response regulator